MAHSAFNVSFRDVKCAVPFLIQMGIFVTPVIYPIRYAPRHWKMLMGLNPMAGVVLGFRHSLLGSAAPWPVIGLSLFMSVGLTIKLETQVSQCLQTCWSEPLTSMKPSLIG